MPERQAPDGAIDYVRQLKEKYSDDHSDVPGQRSLGHMEGDDDWRVQPPMGSIRNVLLPALVIGFWIFTILVDRLLVGWGEQYLDLIRILLLSIGLVLTMFVLRIMGRGGVGIRRSPGRRSWL